MSQRAVHPHGSGREQIEGSCDWCGDGKRGGGQGSEEGWEGRSAVPSRHHPAMRQSISHLPHADKKSNGGKLETDYGVDVGKGLDLEYNSVLSVSARRSLKEIRAPQMCSDPEIPR